MLIGKQGECALECDVIREVCRIAEQYASNTAEKRNGASFTDVLKAIFLQSNGVLYQRYRKNNGYSIDITGQGRFLCDQEMRVCGQIM